MICQCLILGLFVTKLAHSLRVEVLREKKENFGFVVLLLRRQREIEKSKKIWFLFAYCEKQNLLLFYRLVLL